jgi:hypothetical protein
MQSLGHVVVRTMAIAFGLIVAYLAAGMFLAIGLFSGLVRDFTAGLEMPADEQGALGNLAIVGIGLLSGARIAGLALGPSIVAVILAELLGWRGLIANLLLAGVVGLATGWIISGGQSVSSGVVVVLLATGFCGGFFYWLIAGRKAGAWRG